METVLNKKSTDISKQPMFLGETLGIQRYDIVKYPEFKKSYEDQRAQYWQANEVPFTNDRAQFETLSEAEKFVFVNNLMFQTVGDSCLSRTIDSIKSKVSNSELEFAMNWWILMENTHSESYTWILQNMVKNPSQFFEDIYDNEEVMKRAGQLTEQFDKLLGSESADASLNLLSQLAKDFSNVSELGFLKVAKNACEQIKLHLDPEKREKEIKQNIFNTVLSLQIAEGILFYVSFACSYWFSSRGLLKSAGDVIKLINKDEDLHVAITQNIMKRWKNDPNEGFQQIMIENEEVIYEAYRKAVQHEKDWASFLFSKGPLLGLSESILHGYVEWLANIRLRSMGYQQIFETKKNPIGGWIKEFTNSDETDAAPQEKNILDYEKGKIADDMDSIDYDF